MKKILKLAALAAMCFSLASCADFLNFMSKSATFSFSSNTAYVGQQMVVKRLSTCAYEWELVGESSNYCSYKVYRNEESRAINGQDSTMVMTFKDFLGAETEVEITVRAKNQLYPTEEKYQSENSVKLHKWELAFKDCVTDQDVTNLVDGKTYKMYLKDAKTGETINQILYNAAVSNKNRSEETVEFTFPTPLGKTILAKDNNDYPYNANTSVVFTVQNNGTKISQSIFSGKLNSHVVAASISVNN